MELPFPLADAAAIDLHRALAVIRGNEPHPPRLARIIRYLHLFSFIDREVTRTETEHGLALIEVGPPQLTEKGLELLRELDELMGESRRRASASGSAAVA